MSDEAPRYKIHQQSHIDERIVEAGEEITTDARHIPGPHWEPLNDSAKAIAAVAGQKFTGEVPDPLDNLQLALAAATAAMGAMSPEAMAKLATEAATAAVRAMREAMAIDGSAVGGKALTAEEVASIVEAAASPAKIAAIVAQTVSALLDARKADDMANFVAGVQAVLAAQKPDDVGDPPKSGKR